MRIAPEAELGVLAEIFVPDIDAADEPGRAVHDDDLAMVAEVDALVEKGDPRREEALHADAGFLQLLDEPALELQAADPVVDDADLDALLRFAEQRLLEAAADLVVAQRVVVEVDVMLRPLESVQDGGVGRFGIRQHLRLVASGDREHREAAEQVE